MRHKVDTFKIGRSGSHRRAMLANMVSSLFFNGQIETTLVKAKEVRRFAERLITVGKKGDLHRRRLAVAKLRDKNAVKVLFDTIAPAYEGRNGGYTQIFKLGKRRGDAAEMCILKLVENGDAKAVKAAEPAKTEPAKTEPAKTEPAKTEPAKTENAEA